MNLNIIKLVSLCIFTFASLASLSNELDAEPQISFDEFHQNGSKYIGSDVSLSGFLLIDQGMFVYPNLDSFIRYDVQSSVYVSTNDYLKYDSLSGCFVELIGTVGTHKTDKDVYQIKDIKYIFRAGAFYQMAIGENNGVKKEVKCEIEAIIEAM